MSRPSDHEDESVGTDPDPSADEGLESSDSAQVPEADAHAIELFGGRIELARAYCRLLAGDGVAHGLIGPREVPRLWSRHLVNSAVLTDLLPDGARVVDVGSGAGLPGIAMSIRRPDLTVDLLEPMRRRTTFLNSAVESLGLSSTVRVTRGRAEEPAVRSALGSADWVVARAVAPLDRLVRWCLPLLAPGGRLLALKGSAAQQELDEHRSVIGRLGGGRGEVLVLAPDRDTETTWVVSIERQARTARQSAAPKRTAHQRRGRGR